MYVVLSDHRWCENHAQLTLDGWECRETRADIIVTMVGRSLHEGPFTGCGTGSVPKVAHLHCPVCQPDWQPPMFGTPITESELAQVD